ncbi:FKBP-type peptidyl-prolyl cis-trans isomerase [Jannaschia sp. R86511]|uniref:FKBP-type peptidyl-prolyl cis-trans isomerase n=1 Tax=Jannaschia sp. R86511 TaxID=3093853 RepID=UPI0036D29358
MPRTRSGVRAAAVGAAVVLGLAACGDGESGGDSSVAATGSLEGISVEGGFGEPPTIDFEAPFDLEESDSQVLAEGDGEEVEAGDTVTIDYSIASGTDGTELETSFGATTISLPLAEGQTTPALIEALVGQNLGSRVLVAVAPEAPPEGADASAAPQQAQDTIIFVIDMLEVVPERADGTPVDPVDGVPTVETSEEGDVTGITVEGIEPPTELVVTPVIEGDGDEVQATDTVTIHYSGVLAADGTPFDSSWDRGAPTSFPLSNLIQGWQQGLTGVPVGSRVVLQVPAELGYGEAGSPPTIPADAPLVFVIDVLDTAAAPEAPAEPAPESSE